MPPATNPLVLILDDEPLILMDVEELMAAEGYSSRGAVSSKAALALIDNEAFDVAVLDVGMARGDSRAVADALTARNIPFIFCSGKHTPIKGYENVPLVEKPYRADALVAALMAVLPMR